jgi:hypothetical protein
MDFLEEKKGNLKKLLSWKIEPVGDNAFLPKFIEAFKSGKITSKKLFLQHMEFMERRYGKGWDGPP